MYFDQFLYKNSPFYLASLCVAIFRNLIHALCKDDCIFFSWSQNTIFSTLEAARTHACTYTSATAVKRLETVVNFCFHIYGGWHFSHRMVYLFVS